MFIAGGLFTLSPLRRSGMLLMRIVATTFRSSGAVTLGYLQPINIRPLWSLHLWLRPDCAVIPVLQLTNAQATAKFPQFVSYTLGK
jgi:hypothetical protein